jgi:Mn2+/Fe2+ NRAMP family transporter
MGRFTNGRVFNILAWITVVIVILLTVVLVVVSFFPQLLAQA